MRKDYYLSYAIVDSIQNEIIDYLRAKYDFDFIERDSSFLGVYYLYEGIFADKMTIKVDPTLSEDNSATSEKLRLNITIDSGKNRDKESKYKYLKKLFDKDENFTFISEEVLEH